MALPLCFVTQFQTYVKQKEEAETQGKSNFTSDLLDRLHYHWQELPHGMNVHCLCVHPQRPD